MKSIDEIRRVKAAAENQWLKKKGVTGVDVGYKYVKGKRTDELAIRVLVEEKKDVPKKDAVPPTINGVKTDVIKRKFVLHQMKMKVDDIEIKADTGTYNPVKGGISIGPCRAIGGFVYTGTLGAVVKDNATGDPMLLSNFHVMCVDDGWSVGDNMCQPSRVDTGACPADVVGQLQRAVLNSNVDCAVSSLSGRGYSCSIEELGIVMGTAPAALDMEVRKRGRTTGLTYGTVDSLDLSVNIDYGDGLGVVTLTNQIGIEADTNQSPQIGDSGDSGSVVVDNNMKIVGLYFAGNEEGTYGVANPIADVLSQLNVSVCTGFKDFKDEFDVPHKHWITEIIDLKGIVENPWRNPWEWIMKLPPIRWLFEPQQPGMPGMPGMPGGPAAPRGAAAPPAEGLKPQTLQCIAFSTYPVMNVPNPWVVNGVSFQAYDYASNPLANNQIKQIATHRGLDCGYTLDIQLPVVCSEIVMALVHFNTPATVNAYDSGGTLVGTATMSGPQNAVESVIINAAGIKTLKLSAPQDETLMVRFCWKPEGIKKIEKFEKPEKEKPEKFEKPEIKEKPEKLEKPEIKEKPEKFEKLEKEKPEKFENKEFDKARKPEFELPDWWDKIRPPFTEWPGMTGPGGTLPVEDRLNRIESSLAQLTHFIRPEFRPDLSTGALKREPDTGYGGDPYKQNANAKRAKDNKDFEKPTER